MNQYNVKDLKTNISFTEDSYLIDNLFFLPKGLPIFDYHLELLNKWNIPAVFSEGNITAAAMNKLVENIPRKNPEDYLDNNEESSEEYEELSEENIEQIEEARSSESGKILDTSVKSYVEFYKNWIKETLKIFNRFIVTKEIDKEKVKNIVEEILVSSNKNINNALMLFGKKFEGVLYVIPQTIETVILTNLIGQTRKSSPHALSNLAFASYFHDIGMLKIPKSLLEKKEKLTSNEISVIHSHTEIGYKYLIEAKYSAIIASGARQHHERIDGTGYPLGITGANITEIAKIISVVDAYCAAISDKPFKDSPQHAKVALQELLSKGGTSYDASILRDLIKNISLYPIGCLVLLSNNVPARVVGVSGIAMKPIVKELKEDTDGMVIDLSKANDIFIKNVYKINQ